MKRVTGLFVSVVVLGMVSLIQTAEKGNAQQQPAPRTLTVLVSGGQDTTAFDTFFPQTLRIRVGDTVTWKFNADPTHRHTVTLIGGPFPGPKDPVAGGMPGEALPVRWVPVPGGSPGELMANPVVRAPSRRAGAPVETYDGATYVNSGELSTKPRHPDVPKNETFSAGNLPVLLPDPSAPYGRDR